MADDNPITGSGGPMFGNAGHEMKPDIDLVFDSGTLHALRAELKGRARLAGMPENRVGDLILAVHELAANAVRHGAGKGRLRVWSLPGVLRCQVDDGDPLAPDAAEAASQDLVNSWSDTPGHGLWVVRQVVDQMQIVSGPRGTRATIAFDLP